MEKQGPPPAYTDVNQPPQGYGAPPVQQQPAAYPTQQQQPAAYPTQQQGYPVTAAPQHQYQLAPQQTTVLVNTAQTLSEHPMSMRCPSCQADIVTRVKFENGLLTWLVVGGVFIMGGFCGCCLIPLCIDSLKDVHHFCPTCNHKIGVKNKL